MMETTEKTRRPWGTGTIQRHGERFRPRLPAKYKRAPLAIYDTHAEAEAVLDAALHELVAAPLDAKTVDAWGLEWMDTRDVRASTLQRDRGRWKTYVTKRAIGKVLLAELTEAMVDEWLATMRQLAAQTRQNALGLLKQAIAAACRTGKPLAGKSSPAAAVTIKRSTKARSDDPWTWLKPDEIEQALALDVPFKSRIFWTVAVYSALRAGELCGLRDENVDFERDEIHVRWSRDTPPKGGKPRVVKMLPPVRDALRAWIATSKLAGTRDHLGLVFSSPRGGYHADGYDAGWYEAVKGTRLARATLHDLRHTCASHLIQGTWSPKWLVRALRLEEVRDWLGHEDIKTTQRYAHLCADAIGNLVVLEPPDATGHELATVEKPPRRFELRTYGLRRREKRPQLRELARRGGPTRMRAGGPQGHP